MFKECKFSLLDSKSAADLSQEDYEQPDLACTSQLQKWHKKGRGDKISAQPVMEVTISKTKLDDTKTREGVKCLLYDARSNPVHDVQAEMNLKKALQNINPQMGWSVMAKDGSTGLGSGRAYGVDAFLSSPEQAFFAIGFAKTNE